MQAAEPPGPARCCGGAGAVGRGRDTRRSWQPAAQAPAPGGTGLPQQGHVIPHARGGRSSSVVRGRTSAFLVVPKRPGPDAQVGTRSRHLTMPRRADGAGTLTAGSSWPGAVRRRP